MATEVVSTTTTTTTETMSETVVVKVEEKIEGEIKTDENHVDETKPQEAEEANAEAVEEAAPKPEENGIAPPKVRLEQHPPWAQIPSPLPHCLKVETYLRMTKIAYENSYKATPDWSKLPVVVYGGESVKRDIIEFLNTKFEVDPDEGLNEVQKAISRAFQLMVEENTTWSLVQYRWMDNYAETKKYYKGKGLIVPDVRTKLEKNKCHKCLEAHAIGKHTKDQIYSIAEKDLRAISVFLGDKEYFMGSEPTTIDCTMFGLLANLVYAGDVEAAPQRKLIKEELKNLVDFCDRMKLNYWLDWGEICSDEQVEHMKPKKPSLRKKKRTKSASDAKVEAEANGEKAEEKKEEGAGENEAAAAEDAAPAAEEGKDEGAGEAEAEKQEAEEEKKDEETPASAEAEEASDKPAEAAE